MLSEVAWLMPSPTARYWKHLLGEKLFWARWALDFSSSRKRLRWWGWLAGSAAGSEMLCSGSSHRWGWFSGFLVGRKGLMEIPKQSRTQMQGEHCLPPALLLATKEQKELS